MLVMIPSSLACSSLSHSLSVPAASNALDEHRDALTYANAHGAQGVAAARSFKLIERGGHQTRARSAERMAERDRAAVRIDVRRVVGDSVVAQHRQRLRRERLVQLDDIDVELNEAFAAQALAVLRRERLVQLDDIDVGEREAGLGE